MSSICPILLALLATGFAQTPPQAPPPIRVESNLDELEVPVTEGRPEEALLILEKYLARGGPDPDAVRSAISRLRKPCPTASTNFPTANPLKPTPAGGDYDAFVMKFSPTGSNLVYSTYLGGTDDETAEGIAVDSSGSAYVTGYTRSTTSRRSIRSSLSTLAAVMTPS